MSTLGVGGTVRCGLGQIKLELESKAKFRARLSRSLVFFDQSQCEGSARCSAERGPRCAGLTAYHTPQALYENSIAVREG